MASSEETQVTVADAARLAEEGAMLLDVREDDEWQAGHAPQAEHIPMSVLGQELDRLDQARRIFAVCRSGSRSDRVATALRQRGYDAANVDGGMQAWAAAGLAVVTDAGGPGQVI
jgi:rhodanese-related sulfurtransferase